MSRPLPATLSIVPLLAIALSLALPASPAQASGLLFPLHDRPVQPSPDDDAATADAEPVAIVAADMLAVIDAPPGRSPRGLWRERVFVRPAVRLDALARARRFAWLLAVPGDGTIKVDPVAPGAFARAWQQALAHTRDRHATLTGTSLPEAADTGDGPARPGDGLRQASAYVDGDIEIVRVFDATFGADAVFALLDHGCLLPPADSPERARLLLALDAVAARGYTFILLDVTVRPDATARLRAEAGDRTLIALPAVMLRFDAKQCVLPLSLAAAGLTRDTQAIDVFAMVFSPAGVDRVARAQPAEAPDPADAVARDDGSDSPAPTLREIAERRRDLFGVLLGGDADSSDGDDSAGALGTGPLVTAPAHVLADRARFNFRVPGLDATLRTRGRSEYDALAELLAAPPTADPEADVERLPRKAAGYCLDAFEIRLWRADTGAVDADVPLDVRAPPEPGRRFWLVLGSALALVAGVLLLLAPRDPRDD